MQSRARRAFAHWRKKIRARQCGSSEARPWSRRMTSRILLDKVAIGLAPTDHLLAIGIERVVDDPLCGIESVIVFVAEVAEALGNGFEARPFGLMIKGVVRIGTVDDPAEENERVIIGQFVLLQDGFERT